MGKQSPISWTNDTWNPWQGCLKISTGCLNCYMFREKKRYGQNPTNIHRSSDQTFYAPLKKLQGPIIFVCSWSDFFIEQADHWRGQAWDIMRQTPHLFYLILTKRPNNIQKRLPADWNKGYPNVGLGVSVENQKSAWRMHALCEIPAALLFASLEPLLEPVTFPSTLFTIDWVITGGESGTGHNFRPVDQGAFIHIMRQCKQRNIAYFHKQNGGSKKTNAAYGGDLLDGRRYHEYPKIILDHIPKYRKAESR